jgi:mono/diheme cytochrome c family protein
MSRFPTRRWLTAASSAALGGWLACAPALGGEAGPDYASDIRPLFEARCLRCHGSNVRKAELDLSSHAAVMKGGESGPVVVAGKPDESPLFEMVRDGQMPAGKGGKLTPAQVETVRRWIEAGARADGTPSPSAESASASATTVTQHDVYPILLRRCVVCHGRTVREGGLDLRTRASILKGGKHGPAVVPGKPDDSLLLQKVRSGAMPPKVRLIEVSVKPIEPAEIETIARWVALGASEVDVAPDVADGRPDPLVSDKDRDFWAFRSPKPVAPPAVAHPEQVRNPIDAFILAKLEGKGLTLSPEADRLTLLRRVSLDLTGLPPEPEEADAFLADTSPDAYGRLVDRLLASPRYGERWARHWLDVAGYADSEGKREQDYPRAYAWRYRDYVVHALNADKPYDRFLLEQIAGDDLADYTRPGPLSPEVRDNLIATGFLRMAPDPTWAHQTNFTSDRLDIIADEIDVLGSGVMGLTLKCARCHSHKFDPIPQRDYYRLLAVFKGALDEHDWLRSGWNPTISKGYRCDRALPLADDAERRRTEAYNAALRREAQAKKGAKLPEEKLLPPPAIHALWDRGEPSPTYVYRRGDENNPGRLVGPGVPSVLSDGKTPFVPETPWPGSPSTGRRLAFARWLTQPDHPLTARVMVNRVWMHHFGAGIVPSLGNFGKAGLPPTHPELLDWLAVEFVARGWSLKAMHRLMVTSATYRQSSAVSEPAQQVDPENRLYSRRALARMEAEQVYDAMLRVSGCLDETPFGPPDPVTVRPDGLVTSTATPRGWRRSLYVRQDRKQVATVLEVFDLPQMNPNCLERRGSNVATQALHLWNDAMVRTLADRLARRVETSAGVDPARQVDRAFRLALGRPPDDDERDASLDALARLASAWGGEAQASKPLTTFCHTLLNSAAFLYID